MIMKISKLIIPIVALFLFSNCTKNDNTTVVLLGEESYVEDMLSVIPDTLLDVFDTHFGGIYNGLIPPNIEGDFLMTQKQRVFSNITEGWPLDVIEPDVTLSIYNQENRIATLNITEGTETVTDTVYITGVDNHFAVYYTEDKVLSYLGYETIIKRNVIFKGEISEYGIRNLFMASIIADVIDNSNGALFQYNVGDFFIYKDADGFSKKF